MFRRAPIVSDDLGDWILDSFEWVMQRDGAAQWRSNTPLVLPTREFFDAASGNDEKTATAIGRNIMAILGMSGLDIRFEALPALPDEIAFEYGKMADVAGQYWHDDTEPLITYDPRLMHTPIRFIDAMVHELMHGKLHNVIDDIPGGEGAHELATDLHCITHGFGIFQLAGSEDAGWAGYMNQSSRAFALAVFLYLTGKPISQAFPYLPPRSVKLLKRADKECRSIWADELNALS